MDVARTIFRFGNESFVIRPRRRIRLRTFLFALPPPPNHPPIPRTRGQLLSIPLSPPVIVCKSISIRGYRTCLFLMSSLIAARTSPLAGTSGRFTASGGFLYRSEELLEELVAALNREETGTHIREESRQSLWILCKGQLFRSTNDRSMHSKSACIATHRYFLCTVSQWILFVSRYALRPLCLCVRVSRISGIVFLPLPFIVFSSFFSLSFSLLLFIGE